MAGVELLERHAPVGPHQIDETEVPRAENDDVAAGDVVLRRLCLHAGRLGGGVADHRVLLVASEREADAGPGEIPLHEFVEPVAVSLLERRSLRLPVIGEDDELVRPSRIAARPLDPRKLLVELPQRLERVLPLETGMVGDLVIAREGRVDRGPAFHHVGEDAVHDQVAHDDAHRRAQERVHPAAVAARAHVAAALPRRRDQLENHLPAEEDEGTSHVEPVGEERAVARVGRALGAPCG